MKPLNLKFQAFGPFLEEQEIDFTKLQNEGLFLISGPTGAGKTTIFDAICYALYGTGSMGERGDSNARSDFADESKDTYVEFEFQLKDKRIKVYRSPRYERKKKIGEGITEHRPEANIKVYQNEKLIVQTEGVQQVTEKVEEYLRLNYYQFKQIMMIPQGEFRKFILADSNEREEIFKKIFDISVYEKFENNIDEIYKDILDELKLKKERIKNYILNLNIQEQSFKDLIKEESIDIEKVFDLILLEIQKNQELIKIKILEQNKNKKEVDELNTKLQKIKRNNELIDKKENIKREINELLKKQDNIKKKKIVLEKVQKVEKIIPYEDQLVEAKRKLEKAKKESEHHKILLFEKEKEEKTLEKVLKTLEKDYQQLSGIQKEIEELNDKLPKIEEMQNKQKQLKDLETALSLKNKSISKIKEAILTGKTLLEKNEEFIEKNEDIHPEILKFQVENLKKIITSTNKLFEDNSEFIRVKTKYNDILKKIEEKDHEINQLKEVYKNKNLEFINSQAYILASKLKEGEPCPVCGATFHPSPAKPHHQTVTEIEVRDLEKEIQKKEEERAKILSMYDEISKKYSELSSHIDHEYLRICKEAQLSPKKDEEISFHLQDILKAKQNEVYILENEYKEKLNIYNKIKKTKEENIFIKKKIKELEIENEELTKTVDEMNKKKIELSIEIKNLNQQILNKTVEDIQKEIILKENFVKKTQTQYQEKTEKYKVISQEINTLKGNIITLKELVSNYQEEAIRFEKIFNQKIEEMNLKNFEEYQIIKDKMNEVDQLEKVIREYEDELKDKQSILKDLENATKDLQKIDEIPILQEIKLIQKNIENLISEQTRLEERKKGLKESQKSIEETQRDFEEAEKKYRTIRVLRDVSVGNNDSRISLSKYVLTYYFEEILSYANQRLKKLTDNRYRMLRTKNVTDARRKEGLEITIFDNYTAKERPIKTLSGGESFKAALSLALGMADVVQNHSGGVTLDTIFIDEGFGSLDTNSLDNAIEVLMQLNTSGRMVGIISHVNELKERINTKIEVIPDKKGSRIKL